MHYGEEIFPHFTHLLVIAGGVAGGVNNILYPLYT